MSTQIYSIKTSFNSIINYCYFIRLESTNRIIAIDPSWEFVKISNFISENNFILSGILLTHSHIDHTNLADILSATHKCPVFMSRTESEFYNFHCNNLIHLHNEDVLLFQGFKIKPMFTPGHTKGGCCYLIDNNFFSGDTLFIEGCGSCQGNGADPEDMFNSLMKIKSALDIKTKIFPSHCYGRTLGITLEEVLKENIYLQFNNLSQFTKFRMRKNQTRNFDFR